MRILVLILGFSRFTAICSCQVLLKLGKISSNFILLLVLVLNSSFVYWMPGNLILSLFWPHFWHVLIFYRLQYERRERENIHLQLEEARAKLRTSEEDRADCLDRLKDLENQKLQKEKEIKEMKKKMDEEKQSYLQNLK